MLTQLCWPVVWSGVEPEFVGGGDIIRYTVPPILLYLELQSMRVLLLCRRLLRGAQGVEKEREAFA